MKSAIFSVLLLMAVSMPAFAQFSLGAHVAPAFPLGEFANTARTGFGFDVEGRYSINSSLIASAAIGFHSFAFELGGISSDDVSYNITPITFSLYYVLSESELQPYLGLGLGFNRIALETFGVSVADSHFGISPTFGIQYEANEQLTFDLNLKYQYTLVGNNGNNLNSLVDNTSYIPFNLGVFYTFDE